MTPLSTSGRPDFLSGLRVVELTGALAGPYATTVLADLGATVIKVEPVNGDVMRKRVMGPDRVSVPFNLVHRGKQSIAVDVKTEEGREVVRRIAQHSDVLVENFRVGALANVGLAYEDLREVNPDLVYCSISGFGQTGPMRDAKGVDLIAQAYSGLLSVTGSVSGELAKAGYPVSDLSAGMWAVVGILAALQRVQRGEGGAYVDVALADSVAAWSMWEIADYLGTGEVPGPIGTAHRLTAPYEAFVGSDGRTLVIGAVDRLWLNLQTALGVDLDADPRFATESERFRNRAALAAILQERFDARPRDEWIAVLRDAGIPCGPVNSIADIVEDEHFAHRGLFVRDPETFGQDIVVNTPIVSDGAPRAQRRAPYLGEQTESVLERVGYDAAQIDALRGSGVIRAHHAADAGAKLASGVTA
jgi:crotonobetainyl-CoA:carnitine CoA-transferase CaiB-like acyl-CoA transferase